VYFTNYNPWRIKLFLVKEVFNPELIKSWMVSPIAFLIKSISQLENDKGTEKELLE